MKFNILFVFLVLSVIVNGQFSLKKINDSTIYCYLQSRHNILVDPMIPDTIDGYTRSQGEQVGSVEITYEKLIDSFRLVGGKDFNKNYAFTTAINEGSFTVSEQKRRYFRNFFLLEIDTIKKEWLRFDSDSKTFIYRKDVDVYKYTPWWRIAPFWVLLLLISVFIARDRSLATELGESRLKEVIVFSLLTNIVFGGLLYWGIFSGINNYIQVGFWCRTLVWFCRWALTFTIFLFFLRKKKA